MNCLAVFCRLVVYSMGSGVEWNSLGTPPSPPSNSSAYVYVDSCVGSGWAFACISIRCQLFKQHVSCSFSCPVFFLSIIMIIIVDRHLSSFTPSSGKLPLTKTAFICVSFLCFLMLSKSPVQEFASISIPSHLQWTVLAIRRRLKRQELF